jgi:hypothetical protein
VSALGVQAGVSLVDPASFFPVASCFTDVGDCSSFVFNSTINGKTLTCVASGLLFLPAIETPVNTYGTFCTC